MVWDMIITGLSQIFGFQLVAAMLIIFLFVFFGLSRGVGAAGLMVTLGMSFYLFGTQTIGGINLIDTPVFLLGMVIFGLFLGYLFYINFIRE